MPRKAHVAEWKKKEVAEVESLLNKYPVIGVASVQGYPAKNFQELRQSMGEEALVRVVKLKLFKIALKKHPELKELEEHLNEPSAFIFTEMNPFKLFKILKKNASKTYAKAGQTAKEDIVVPPGDTGIPPGPALGDLRNAGIQAKIDGGSIKVAKESVVVKAGEKVTPEAASALMKLDVKPFEVMLSLQMAYENGTLFSASTLDISEEDTLQNLQSAYMNAFNLSFNAGYFTKQNIEPMIGKAFQNARGISVEANILNKATVGDVLSKASAQAKAVSGLVKEPEPSVEKKETKEEPKEEPKEEVPEKTEEKKDDESSEEKK